MSTQQIKSNPFDKTSSTMKDQKTIQTQEKKDTMRDNVKNQLLNALEPKLDAQILNIKYTSNDLSMAIEKCVFEQKGSDSRSRDYREKIRKLESRLKGNRNSHVREALKTGSIEAIQFCSLDDKTLDDESYFQSLCKKDEVASPSNNTQSNPQQNAKKKPMGIKPPNIIKLPAPTTIPFVQTIDDKDCDGKEDAVKEKDKSKPIIDNAQKGIEMSCFSMDNDVHNEKIEEKEKKPVIEIPIIDNDIIHEVPGKKKEEKKNVFNQSIPTVVQDKEAVLKEDSSHSNPQTNSNENSANNGLDMPAFLDLKKKLELRKKDKKNKKEIKKQPQPQSEPFVVGQSSQKIEEISLNNTREKQSLLIIEEQSQEEQKQPLIKPTNPFEEKSIPIIQEPIMNSIIDQPKIVTLPQHQIEEGKNIQSVIIQSNNQPEENNIFSQPQQQPKEEKEDIFNALITQNQAYSMSAKEHHPTTNIIQHTEISPILTHRTKQQDFAQIKSQSNANENYLSSSQMESSYSLVNQSGIKEKYKIINEAKLALETRMEIMKLEALAYQKEINALKSSVNQLRQTSSQSNEEILKLELIKTKQILKSQENEKEFLQKENNKLKIQLKTYENNLASMIEDNKLFRSETEKRFTLYQKDIDMLRSHLTMKTNNNSQPAISISTISSMNVKEIERSLPRTIPGLKIIDKRPNNEDYQNLINTQTVANGIPEQNLDGLNNNINMNGNIYDESKHNQHNSNSNNNDEDNNNDNDNDSNNNQLIPIYEDYQQLNDFNENIIINEDVKEHNNNPLNEIPIKNEDKNKENVKSTNETNHIPINEIKPIVNNNDEVFEKVTRIAQIKPSPSLKMKVKEISPQKIKPNLNELFGSDDDDEDINNIFGKEPQQQKQDEKKITLPTQMKKSQMIIPVKPKLEQQHQQQQQQHQQQQQQQQQNQQSISKVSQNIPQTVQQMKNLQKQVKIIKPIADKNNLFDALEEDANDEDIFNKNDGESIFGKSCNQGNSIFD